MFTILILFLAMWGGVFLILRNKYLKSRFIKKAVISSAVAITIFIVYAIVALELRPSGPFDPLSSSDFFFDKPGSREMTFTPRFFRNHEIAIISSQPFPMKEHFSWKAHVQVYRFGIKIDDHELRENSRTFVEKSQEYCKDISFGWIRTFDLIPGKTDIRITVLQGDPGATKYSSSFKVVVRPSPII